MRLDIISVYGVNENQLFQLHQLHQQSFIRRFIVRDQTVSEIPFSVFLKSREIKPSLTRHLLSSNVHPAPTTTILSPRQPHPARSNDDATENTDADRNIIMNIPINISTDTLFRFPLPRKGKYLLDSTMARYQVSDASSLTIVTVTTKSQSPIMIKTRLCYILIVDHRECRRIQRRTLSFSCSSHMNNSTVTMWAVIRI